jgi:hypothetical protein
VWTVLQRSLPLPPATSGTCSSRRWLGYRLLVTSPAGRFVVEQQAFLEITEGRITWMRVLCSGFRPTAG